MIKILVYERRTEKKLSLEALERICGVSNSQINNIENEKQSPTLHTLELIARGLDCKVKDLFEEL